jgi:hypothetical protein
LARSGRETGERLRDRAPSIAATMHSALLNPPIARIATFVPAS